MMIVGGRLRSKKGAAIVGARVEVIDLANGGVIASGFSDVRGNFCLRLNRAEEAAQKTKRLAIRAVGQGDDILVEPVRLPRGQRDTVTIDLTASVDRVRNFKPVAPPLRRLTGPVLDSDVLPLLDSAVGLVVPKGEPGYNRFVRVVRHCLPALARFESVLDDAWMVIDGDQSAGQRLRRALIFLANLPVGTPPIQAALFNIQPSRQSALFPFPTPDDGFPIPEPGGPARSCALPVDRLLPILTATLRIATDAEDGSSLLAGLDAGLVGIRRFDLLNGLAQEALSSGKPGPLSDELSRLATEMSINDDLPFEGGLDWPYPPPDRIPPQPFEPCHDLRTKCFQGLVDSWKGQFALNQVNFVSPYQITSVLSDTACPGETVIIEGNGFGTFPGQVLFPDRAVDAHISVDPVPGTWASGRIEAVVPLGAASGLMRLAILDGSLATCAGAVSVYRQGNGIAFRGGAPYVSSVTINGNVAGSVVAPNSDYVVAWRASPARSTPDPVLVQVYEEPPLVSVFAQPMPASGSVTLRAGTKSGVKIRAVVVAFGGACGAAPHNRRAEADIVVPSVPNNIRIEGIEVTQGIQIFSLQGPQNTLTTIAAKDTIVRVYVSALSNLRVTGMLDVDGIRLSPINGITPDNPSGGNPFITARPVGTIDRTQTDHSLNFRIPAYLCSDIKSLYALVFAPGPSNTTLMDRESLRWRWEPQRALPVRFVRLQDDRPAPDGTGSFPTDAEARHTLERAFDLLPTPATDIAPVWWYPTHSVTTSDITTVWFSLYRLLDPLTGPADPIRWIGLSDTFIWASGWKGRALDKVAVAVTYKDDRLPHQGDFRIVSPHEIAHTLGAACHTDSSTCSLMLPYLSSSVSLTDVTFDPYWNEAFFPASDVMQTAVNFIDRYWISPALWNFLRLNMP